MDRQIAELCPKDVGQLRRYMAENRVKLEKFRPILESSFRSPWDLLRPSVLAAASKVHPLRSLGAELERYFSDPRLVIAFAFQAKYLGMSPFNCPSLFSILSYLEYEYGVFHPLGGCSRVSERMADIAQEMGVKIRLSEPVESIELRGKRLMAVRTASDRFEAEAFVVNADFADWMTRTVPNEMRRRWKNEKIAKKKFSCSTYMLYLGIDGLYQDLPHHNIHISKSYDQNLRDIEVDHVLSDDPSVYVQNACVTDPGLAPSGSSTLYVLVPVSHQHSQIDWSHEAEPFREKTLDQLANIGLGDVRERIRFEHQITPDDWQSDYAIYKGATVQPRTQPRSDASSSTQQSFRRGRRRLFGWGREPIPAVDCR